ncbi:TIGR02444 family protein [Glaciecola sp. XM2]|uniref:TIGR02444 family protein n=1 Tax=Glaciecola sp. XM2 TaxID=1914931 RepID=UPI001BDDFF8B|nr:TIGR02444 family protein [Glaciecola sp. XM2]
MFKLEQSDFWDYSLLVYKHDEVKHACLHLQDMMHLNVNILLLMMYLRNHNKMLAFDDIQKLESAINASDMQLKKHRAKRRGLTHVDESLYKEALAQELELERLQQAQIVTFANTLSLSVCDNTAQLSDQLVALCMRELTRENAKRDKTNKALAQQDLIACRKLAEHACLNERN